MTLIRTFFRRIYIALLGGALSNIDGLLDEAHSVLVRFDDHVQKLDRRVEARLTLAQQLAERNAAEMREAARAASIRDRIADILGID